MLDNDKINVTAQPSRITAGGIVLLTASTNGIEGHFDVTWKVEGPVRLSDHDTQVALLGAASVTGSGVDLDADRNVIRATLDTSAFVNGSWRVGILLTPVGDDDDDDDDDSYEAWSDPIEVQARPFAAGDDVTVTMRRTAVVPTADQALWAAIRGSSRAMSFESFSRFMDLVVCGDVSDHSHRDGRDRPGHLMKKISRRMALPFPNVERYRLAKVAANVFVQTHCGVHGDFTDTDLIDEGRRQNRALHPGDLEAQWEEYLARVPMGDGETLQVIPYLALIRAKLSDVAIVSDDDESVRICQGILAEKLTYPTFIELIWSYWLDEGFLEQTMNAIAWRFQNRGAPTRDPLANLEIDPLRPLSNILWGREQDRQHRLTTARRAYEYDHEYGLTLAAMSGPPVRGADSRVRFVESFHNLLRLCLDFYREDDVTTVIADAFGVLNALKETHMILAQGAHNQFGDLPSTSRQEFLVDQWILDRPEIRTFLPTRTMVVNPEGWIDAVQAMAKLQGWTDTSIVHFRDLAVFGEQLLLSVRFAAWSDTVNADAAGNWARGWRPEVQQYVHAYRAVTGVDLARTTDVETPAYHLRQRQLAQRR